jgi:hypothetical protein
MSKQEAVKYIATKIKPGGDLAAASERQGIETALLALTATEEAVVDYTRCPDCGTPCHVGNCPPKPAPPATGVRRMKPGYCYVEHVKAADYDRVVAERDNAIARGTKLLDAVCAERDEARAECERLRAIADQQTGYSITLQRIIEALRSGGPFPIESVGLHLRSVAQEVREARDKAEAMIARIRAIIASIGGVLADGDHMAGATVRAVRDMLNEGDRECQR